MPLTEKVNFKTPLQRGNRVQIPKLVRWQFKLEPNQVLKVTVRIYGLVVISETFYAQMGKDGRVVIPKLILDLLKRDKPSLEGDIMEIILEPS